MRSIQRRFMKVQELNPTASTLICFARAIEDQAFTPQMVKRWFYLLVDEDDYDIRDKKEILEYLIDFLKPEDDKNRG